jgi:transcriptional regulator with XRE-family HTH domain
MAKATRVGRRQRAGTKPRPRVTRWARRKPRSVHLSHGLTARIRAVCEGRSFDEVCAATGIHEVNVRRFWHGMNKPSIDFVQSLCLAYGVSPHWLLTGLGQRRLRR